MAFKTTKRSLRRLTYRLEAYEEWTETLGVELVWRTVDCVTRVYLGIGFAKLAAEIPDLLRRLELPDRKALADWIRRDPYAAVPRMREALRCPEVDQPPFPPADVEASIRHYEARHGMTLLLGNFSSLVPSDR